MNELSLDDSTQDCYSYLHHPYSKRNKNHGGLKKGVPLEVKDKLRCMSAKTFLNMDLDYDDVRCRNYCRIGICSKCYNDYIESLLKICSKNEIEYQFEEYFTKLKEIEINELKRCLDSFGRNTYMNIVNIHKNKSYKICL